jgi:tetratricopeptide (TPR) repeat protein
LKGKEQIDEEIDFLKKGLGYNPGNAGILYKIGNCFVRENDLSQAQTIADQIDQTSTGGKINYIFLSAQIAEARQDYTTAIQFYEQGKEFQDPDTRKAMEFQRDRCRKLMKENKVSKG